MVNDFGWWTLVRSGLSVATESCFRGIGGVVNVKCRGSVVSKLPYRLLQVRTRVANLSWLHGAGVVAITTKPSPLAIAHAAGCPWACHGFPCRACVAYCTSRVGSDGSIFSNL